MLAAEERGRAGRASLNLTPARGPSVWDRPLRQSTAPWHGALRGASLVLLALGWPYRTPRRQAIAFIGLAGLLASFGRPFPAKGTILRLLGRGRRQEIQVDSALEATFPASDPVAH